MVQWLRVNTGQFATALAGRGGAMRRRSGSSLLEEAQVESHSKLHACARPLVCKRAHWSPSTSGRMAAELPLCPCKRRSVMITICKIDPTGRKQHDTTLMPLEASVLLPFARWHAPDAHIVQHPRAVSDHSHRSAPAQQTPFPSTAGRGCGEPEAVCAPCAFAPARHDGGRAADARAVPRVFHSPGWRRRGVGAGGLLQ